MIGHAIAAILCAMADLRPLRTTCRCGGAKVRVAELAARQWGVVSHAQLIESGVNRTVIGRWVDERRLHRVHPGVFAVGHLALGIEGRMAAALFYAGRGAALSHVTAAWWFGLLEATPRRLHVTVTGRRRSLGSVRIHRRRNLKRIWHRRLRVTSPAQTLLDIAGMIRMSQLRRALAEAEYLGLLTLDEVEAVLGRGRPGSAALRAALDCHRPELARTRSLLEEKFVLLCERHSLTPPGVNVQVAGWLVDAVWFDQRVAVELDGHAAHHTHTALERDHRRDLDLRAAGYTVLRYTWTQITEQPELVASDLRSHL
jgi:very-short-patch-repair endonuclease